MSALDGPGIRDTARLRQLIDYFVLDALADDIESLEDVLRLVNHDAMGWRRHNGGEAFTRDVLVPPVLRGVREGLIEVFELTPSGGALSSLGSGRLPPNALDDYWFGLTAAGRLVHQNWQPPE